MPVSTEAATDLDQDVALVPDEAHDALVGTVLNERYRLVRVLGKGGMGTVYEAHSDPAGTRVAIKVLQRGLSANERDRKRFLREAKAASAIANEHIVRALDFGTTAAGSLYLAMELLDGEDLEQCLARCTRFEWEAFEPLFEQVLVALQAAHGRGVIHRDIKPSNCFLCQAKQQPTVVKILDFGIAKISGGGVDGEDPIATMETLTGTNELFGTAAYMAPELIDGVSADPRSDIYALGVMLFRALTGELPFTGSNAYKVFQHHVGTPVPSMRALVPQIPAAVESVVFRAMAKKPEHRYQQVAELAAALSAAKRGVIEPSAAGLSGSTQAFDRRHMSTARAGSPTTPLGGFESATQLDRAQQSLTSARLAAPRFSLLSVVGLVLVMSGITAALVVWFSGVGGRSDARATPEVAPSRIAAPVVLRAKSVEEPAPVVEGNAASTTALPVKEPAAGSSEPAGSTGPVDSTTGEVPDDPRPTSASKRRSRRSNKTAEAKPVSKAVSIAQAAGKRCPDAVGETFRITGLMSNEGRYMDPNISGGTKPTRDCIDRFIRKRQFPKPKKMMSRPMSLTPR